MVLAFHVLIINNYLRSLSPYEEKLGDKIQIQKTLSNLTQLLRKT